MALRRTVPDCSDDYGRIGDKHHGALSGPELAATNGAARCNLTQH